MKKIKILVASLIIGSIAYAQQPPTGGAGGGAFWRKGGNNIGNGFNIFGTMFNSPIYTYTNGVGRGIRNGDRTPNINGFNVNTSGYMGIGPNSVGSGHSNGFWQDVGPYSLLHLNGVTTGSDFVFPGGYRPWMRTGITFSDQIDLAYVGLRSVDSTNNINEMVINWSNDPNVGTFGPDDMVFRFSRGSFPVANSTSGNFSANNDLDGLHIARFTGTGEMGLGPTFGVPQSHPNYVRPQSILHISEDDNLETWIQITNELRTNQTANDGLRLGIRAGADNNGYLRWQEITPFIIQTDWNIIPGGIGAGERMRISSINAPGVPNPSGLPNNTTRVAISHQGGNPITEPRSLLHLGYNTGAVGPPAAVDGWRPWMDIGTFTNNGTDNMYVGLIAETGAFPASDRHDAVINWGDNGTVNPLNGPDNLRFIFTETATGIGSTPPANTLNGLEVARMTPGIATTLPAPNFGMMGIGDFTIAAPINAKLDIDGDLRIREVTNDSMLTMVLVIDSTDLNRVHWRDAATLGGGNVTADNGTSIDPLNLNNVQLGQIYVPGALNFTGIGELIHHTEVPLNGFNLVFSGIGNAGTETVAIGQEPIQSAKFSVFNDTEQHGILSQMDANSIPLTVLISGFRVKPAIRGVSLINNATTAGAAVGVVGEAVSNASWGATGIVGYASGIGIDNEGGRFDAVGASQFNNYGVKASANGSTGNNYGVWAGSPIVTGVNYAAWFEGDVAVNGTPFILNPALPLSDGNLKTSINNINNAQGIINQLIPKTFFMDTANGYGLNFPSQKQYGFIAQDVELILPELVNEYNKPAVYDSTGNIITPSGTFKNLNYNAFIAILTKGMQEQQTVIDSLMATVQTLSDCMENANICSGHARLINNEEEEGKVIQLDNLNAIILDQNLPNPFKEKTSINYSIPEEVMEAQLLFYDMSGRIIKQVDISERGEGKLTVYGENLKNGIYTYSLIADGELIATKRMVKSK